MKVITERIKTDPVEIATEILSLPKTGKTTSPEHRAALFTMLANLPSTDKVSLLVVDSLPPLIGKEGNEPAMLALCHALSLHLAHALVSPQEITSTDIMIRELGSTKLSTRRAVISAIGTAIWSTSSNYSTRGESFITELVPSFEAAFKSASANLPANPPGYLEGYVVVALAMGPLAKLPAGRTLSLLLNGILTTTPKPSFVLNSKAHAKLPTIEDERWLLRSLEAIVSSNSTCPEPARIAIGLALIHLVFDSSHHEIRREALASITSVAKRSPKIISRIIRESLKTWLNNPKLTSESDDVIQKSRDIGRLLSATLVRGPDIDSPTLEDIAVDFVVLAHHPEINESSQTSWISLVQNMGLDPATVAFDKRVKILKLLWEAAPTPSEVSMVSSHHTDIQDARMAEAAYRAIATLAFICPAVYVEVVLEQARQDLDPSSLEFIGLEERGIWQTPSDQLFVDGTSSS